jgi:para-nitrobenzyl esterase
LFATAAALAAISDPVRLETGLISGANGATSEMRIYRGIPFAAPPVADLRWRAPQPPPRWQGVRKADKFGPICMQNAPGGAAQPMGEDCLYLNVWTAAKSAGDKRPVMVWIYGGGYNIGSGSQPEYDGEALARKGAVIVTINYRLGVFGFFSHPELTRESDRRAAGNFGLMDVVAALQWVQKNIAAFGGDPKRVTIFGESAGAGLVANLMATPQAKGLFHRAIGESSSWTTASINKLNTLAEAEQAGVKYAEGLAAKSLAELRRKPADAILRGGRGAGPIVDGYWLPEDTGAVFAKGKHHDVPVMTGSNRDESFGAQPRDLGAYVDNARRRYGDLADTFLKVYPASTDEQARDAAFNAGRDEMAWVMRNWARLAARNGKTKSFVYYFTQQPPVQANAKGGKFAASSRGAAVHTAEIQYVFGNLRGNREWTDWDRQLSGMMGSYWVNFAANGDPNGKGLPVWPVFDGEKNKSAILLGPKVEPGSVLNESQAAVMQAYYDRQYR